MRMGLAAAAPCLAVAGPALTATDRPVPALGHEDGPPAYVPLITPPPDQDAMLAGQGFRQETFYTCHSADGTAHCGWHVPVVRAAAPPGDGAVVAAVAALAALFALAMT